MKIQVVVLCVVTVCREDGSSDVRRNAVSCHITTRRHNTENHDLTVNDLEGDGRCLFQRIIPALV
jgi:hypothetical protein